MNEPIAPGVLGYTVEKGDDLYVPFVMAEKEGNGDVGRYLDGLPTDRRIVFPDVLSGRLLGMLVRRGYHLEIEYTSKEEYGFVEPVECWVRDKT
jgi:hypothetical protein